MSRVAVHDHAWMFELGLAMRRRRRALRLSQDVVAEVAGVSRRFVHQVEHGKATAPFAKVVDVLAVLGLQLMLVDGHAGLVVDATPDGWAEPANRPR